MIFDMTTSLVTTLMIFIVGLASSIILWFYHQEQRKIYKYLVIMYVLLVLGFEFILLRLSLSPFFTFFLANIFIFTSGFFALYALCKIYKTEIPISVFITGYILFIASMIYFTYSSSHLSVLFIVLSFGQLFWSGLLLYVVVKKKDQEQKLLFYTTILILINSIVMILLSSIMYNSSVSWFDQDGLSVNILLIGLLGFLFLFAIDHLLREQQLKQFRGNKKTLDFLYNVYYSLPIPVMVVDSNFVVRKLNRFCCDVKTEEALHKKIEDVFDKKTAIMLEEEMTLLGQGHESTVCEVRITNSKEEFNTYEVVIQIVYDQDEPYYVLLFRERKELEGSFLKQYDLLLEGTNSITSIGFWEIDVQSKILHADSRAKEIYEMEDVPYDIPLENVQKAVLQEYRPYMDKALSNLIENEEKYDVMFEIVTKSGTKRHVHSKAALIKSGGRKLVVGTIQDITSYKTIEEEVTFLKEHDALTKLLLRDVFERRMSDYVSIETLPLTILVCDFNNLTEINKMFGYTYGNKLLIESVQLFEEVFGEESVLARIREDMFAVLLTNTDEARVEELISILEDAFHKRYSMAKDHKITWSYGHATLRDIMLPIENTYNRAITQLEKYKSYYNQAKQTKSLDAIMQTLFEKDPLSEIHSTRVAHYAKRLAIEFGLSKAKASEVETAALLHDIGKILVEDTILKSTSALTDEEYEILKRHPVTSYNILSAIPEMRDVAKIVLAHHERIDGNGYPYHIRGQSIPLESKIISIADAYDAMTGKRNYRNPYVKEEAILELLEHRGSQFDEELVNTFVDMLMKDKKDPISKTK